MLRACLVLLLLGITGPAMAAVKGPLKPTCKQMLPNIRAEWQQGVYDAPPNVSALMVDAIDGKLKQVREALAAMKPADAKRWRQTAMLTAVAAEQFAIVDAMLDDGAAVDGKAWIPPFKTSFYGQTLDAMKHDPHFGGAKTVKNMQDLGVIANRGQHIGPAIIQAASCGDVATVNVLLRHHANANASEGPTIVDALMVATVQANVPVAQALLDHGASACHEEQRKHRLQAIRRKQGDTDTRHRTFADIAANSGMPPSMVKRLTCQHPAPAG